MKYITKYTEIDKEQKTANIPELFVGINSDRELIFLDINDRGNYFAISGDSVMAVKEDNAEEQTKERIIDFYEQEPPTNLYYVISDGGEERLRDMVKEHYTFYAEDIANESSDEYTNRLAEEMLDAGVISEEEAKEEEYDLDNDIDDFAEKLTDDAGDPYQYFVDSFGEEEANRIVIDNGLLDLDKVAEQEDWRDWFDNSTLTDEVDYKGDTYLFEALGGGQNRDQLDRLIVSFVPETILEKIKSNWDKYHLKVLPKKDYFPEIEQDKDEILEWYLEHGTMDSRSPLPEYAKGGKIEKMYNVYYIDHLYGGKEEYETTTNNFEKWLKETNADREAEGETPYEEMEFRVEEISMDKYAKGGEVRKYKWVENIGTSNRRDLSLEEFDEVYKEYKNNPNWEFTLDTDSGKTAYNEEMKERKHWSRKYDFSYAKGGTIDGKIKEWYKKNYPTDDLVEEMNDTNTFEDLEDALNKGDNVYAVIGESDSVIRERLFEHLAKLKGVKYKFIYEKWLAEGMLTDNEIKSKLSKQGYAKGGEVNPYFVRRSFYSEITPDGKEEGLNLMSTHIDGLTGTGNDERVVYYVDGYNYLLEEEPELRKDEVFRVTEEIFIDYTDKNGKKQKAYMEANSPDEVVRTLKEKGAKSIERMRPEWEVEDDWDDYMDVPTIKPIKIKPIPKVSKKGNKKVEKAIADKIEKFEEIEDGYYRYKYWEADEYQGDWFVDYITQEDYRNEGEDLFIERLEKIAKKFKVNIYLYYKVRDKAATSDRNKVTKKGYTNVSMPTQEVDYDSIEDAIFGIDKWLPEDNNSIREFQDIEDNGTEEDMIDYLNSMAYEDVLYERYELSSESYPAIAKEIMKK